MLRLLTIIFFWDNGGCLSPHLMVHDSDHQIQPANLLFWDARMEKGTPNSTNSKFGSPWISIDILWISMGITLGSLWRHLEIILGSLWDHFGNTLGSLWCHFGITLGSLWDRFGISLGSLRGNFGIHPGIQEPSAT